MTKLEVPQVIRTNLAKHPAVRAWRKLQRQQAKPERIDALRIKRRRSWVYRLVGVGPAGSDVIAKRRWRAGLVIERTLYDAYFRDQPVLTPRYFGFVEDPDRRFAWLFLESVVGNEYSPLVEQHRRLAGRWLGMLHASSTNCGLESRLPERGPKWYLKHLCSTRQAILQNLDNPALASEHTATLKAVVAKLTVLESRWSDLAAVLDKVPRTLVHGDFIPANVIIRNGHGGAALQVFDWEDAGWGVPAVDLAQAAPRNGELCASPDIAAYWSIVRDTWTHLDIQDVLQLANIGTLLRCLVVMDWGSWALAYRYQFDHHYQWLERFIGYARMCEAMVAEVI